MKYADELQIELDDVYACSGKCPGCILTSEERKNFIQDMSDATRQRIFSSLEDYIPTLSGLKRMNLTYGIANHLLMPTDYLIRIYEDAASLFEKVGLAGSIFMSTSMIGKTALIKEKLTALSEASKNYKTKLYPIVVLDPSKLNHISFGKTYAHHIAFSKELFGVVDLAINLSDMAITDMPAQKLVDFAKEYGFNEVTINWVPTHDNIKATYSNKVIFELKNWLLEFAAASQKEHIECSYVPVIQKAYDVWRCALDGEENDGNGVFYLTEKVLPETLKKSLQFDHTGNVFPKFEAIGDVLHNERVGLNVWGNVHSGHNLKDLVNQGMQKTIQTAIKTISGAPCYTCDFSGFCATTGFHIYTHVLKWLKADELLKDCPHVAKTLIQGLCLAPH